MNDLTTTSKTPNDLEEKKYKLDFNPDESKSYEERAKDVATVIATEEALNDKSFVDDIAEQKKKELSETAKTNLKNAQAKSKDAVKTFQASLFGVYEGLASYIGLSRQLPEKMLKVLMFVLQPVLGLVFIVVGLFTGIVNITLDAANSVVTKFSDLAENTRKAVKALAIITLIVGFLFVLKIILERFGIVLF